MAFDIGGSFRNLVSRDGGGSFSLGLISMGPVGFTDSGTFGGAFDLIWNVGRSINHYIDADYDAFDFLNTAIDVIAENPDGGDIQAPSDANDNTAGVTLYDYWNGSATSYYYQDRNTHFSRDFDIDPSDFSDYRAPHQYGFEEYETW